MNRSFDPSKRPPQQAVRVGRFVKELEAQRAELGERTAIAVAMALAKFADEYVRPLDERIEVLETLLGIRAYGWVRDRITVLFRGASDERAEAGDVGVRGGSVGREADSVPGDRSEDPAA